MAALNEVGIINGVPTTGTGEVATINALMALLGEVQASPTANTALDRLKALATLLTAHTSLLDGLEAQGATANAFLATLATEAKLEAIRLLLVTQAGYLDGLEGSLSPLATETKLEAVRALLAGTLTARPSTDQDPIFDHTNGTKTSVTASAIVITPPTGCKFIRISADVDIFVNTAGAAAVDNGTSLRLVANQPEVIPVVAGTAVYALASSGTAVVRCTPLKVR